MPTSSAPAPRAPRRDALRNDARVIEAARAVFAERGPAAGMEEIATRAGVGVGTIYRRFPGKEALLAAIAQQFVDELEAAADTALADTDVEHGLRTFLEFAGRFDREKQRYAQDVIERTIGEVAGASTVAKVETLTERAVAAGVLDPGTTVADITALLVALRAVVATSPPGDDGRWLRFLGRHLDGLRPRN
jgi:AcrR family transcriptional regulator